jgi:hypothetical protein
MYWDKRLPQDYEDLLREYGYSPHCDAAVLHGPSECMACDSYPVLQRWRLENRIAFTGELPQVDPLVSVVDHLIDPRLPVKGSVEPYKRLCWAEVTRPLEMIYKWPGNLPITTKQTFDTPPRAGNG